MDYGQLKTAIETYLQNSGATFTGSFDTFIRIAEDRIRREIITPDMVKSNQIAVTAGDFSIPKPVDYISTRKITSEDAAGDMRILVMSEPSMLAEIFPSPLTGTPVYYADIGNEFNFAPMASGDFTITLDYIGHPPSIVDDTVTWLGENAPSLLLYGCLAEAYRFLKGDADLMAEYEGKYKEALETTRRILLSMQQRDDANYGEVTI